MSARVQSIEANDLEASACVPAIGRTSATSHLPALPPADLSFLLNLLGSARGGNPGAFPGHGNVPLLWEYLERHGLGGLLGACVEQVESLPSGLAEAARQRYWSNSLHGEQARRRCHALVRTGQQLGLKLFFVKGPALVDQAYGDDGLRGFSDIDLFTGSAQDARRLAATSAAHVVTDSEREGLCSEIWDTGRVVLEFEGWPVEIRFPMPGWSGPLFDFFPSGLLPRVEWTANGLPVARPEWHFLFLVHHLSMHHFFGRFIWLLDLGVLFNRHRAVFDWDLVTREARRLGMGEALAAAGAFCRRYVDPRFPEALAPVASRAWNRPFIRHLLKPEVIASSTRNKQQVSAAGRGWAILHGACSYLLLADAPATGPLWKGRGGQWMTARLCTAARRRWRSRWGSWLAGWLSDIAPLLFYPLARFLAWIAARQKTS